MLTCKEASRLLSEAGERRLSLRERIALRFHLLICALCRRYARHLRFLAEAMRTGSKKLSEAPDARLGDAARARIQERLKRL